MLSMSHALCLNSPAEGQRPTHASSSHGFMVGLLASKQDRRERALRATGADCLRLGDWDAAGFAQNCPVSQLGTSGGLPKTQVAFGTLMSVFALSPQDEDRRWPRHIHAPCSLSMNHAKIREGRVFCPGAEDCEHLAETTRRLPLS